MVRYNPYLDEIEKVIGRGRHVHRIEEGSWAVDIMSTLNCISMSIAKDLAAELGKPTWDYMQEGQVIRGNPFHEDPHPRLLGLALVLLSWLWWQEPNHKNIPKETMRKLVEEAWKQGEERGKPSTK